MGPEEVVRAFLEAEARFEPSAQYVVKPLATFVRIADRFNRAVGVEPEQHALNIRRLRLQTSTDSAAAVDLDAYVLSHVGTRFGATTQRYRFRGPVVLTRVDGEWKIGGYTVDGVPLPRGLYTPLVEEQHDGIFIALGAQLSKTGTFVSAEVVNEREQPVVVDDFTVSLAPLGTFTARWGGIHVPALVAAGESWADVVVWSGLSARRGVTATVRVAGVDHSFVLEPPRRVGPLRRRLRPLYGIEGLLYAALALGAISSAVTGTTGLLGLAAFPGVYAAARAARACLAGFWSSWAAALGALGLAEVAVGSAAMLSSGFGWIGTLVVIGSMAFALQQTVAHARRVRVERAGRTAQVATGSNTAR